MSSTSIDEGRTATVASEICRFLRSGQSDETGWYDAWPGRDFFDRARHADTTLRETLVEEVLRRASAVPSRHVRR
jgi:hypothetical protein